MKLEDIRRRLDELSWQILLIIKERLHLVEEVARQKKEKGNGVIHAPGREAEIFHRLLDSCRILGLNPDYLKEVFSLMIAHAKDAECDVLGVDTFLNTHPVPRETLRRDLLDLTQETAGIYTDRYCAGVGADAIQAYLLRERQQVQKMAESLCGLPGLAIDLGCATGDMTAVLAPFFQEVIGYDISPYMTQAARARGLPSHIRFEEQDLEKGIPVEAASVALAVANFGAASEVSSSLFAEIQRVLVPGGMALLSFYNSDAISSRWYYPWPATLRAHHNRFNNTVEVWVRDKVFTVSGIGTTMENVQKRCEEHGLEVTADSYPTLLSIMPRFFFTSERFKELIVFAKEIDESLAKIGPHKGTYLTVVVRKR